MRISVNSLNLNVIDTGGGALTLIFLHYFGGSALEWQGVMNQLSDTYRCVAIDLRGFGDSDAPESGYSVDDMADDVANLIQVLRINDFVLIGHSMSGKVALALAAGTVSRQQQPGMKSLILVSPSPPVPEPIPDDERQKLLNGYGQRSAAEKTQKNITAKPISKAIQNQIITDDLRTSKPAWNAWLLSGSKEDISDRMQLITIPVSIIVGSEDRALPPDVQHQLVLPYLKNATLTIIDGAGHLLPWEVPVELADFIHKKVISFLSE